MALTEKIKTAFGSVRASSEEKRKAVYGVEMHRRHTFRRRLGAIVQWACVCTAAVLALVFFSVYGNETAYVSIDVNPSISLAINDFGRVIEARGYGTESEQILDTVRVTGQPYGKAVSELLAASDMQPYLASNTTLWIAVQASNPAREAEMEQTVTAAAQSVLAANQPSMEIASSAVSEEVRTVAEDAGLSATRYIAIIEIQEVDPSARIDDLRDEAIHDLLEEAASHHEMQAAEIPASSAEPAGTPAPAETPKPVQQTPALPAETEVPAAPAQPAAPGHHGHEYHHGGGHH